ncbi:hypothetical protein LMG28614_00445 [Paraburkholderia ultramafica]|uniref:Uncharacterized protein n=1 Tax=Paraburkholderia ultramafica TaxID=1544867 RepID=A0A6S7AUM9_9BURK|nr:hypothetical protein LMG28614_00445 [Paraburkholderia ultramafica]
MLSVREFLAAATSGSRSPRSLTISIQFVI